MFRKFIASFVCITFIFSNFQYVHAQDFSINQLPIPGKMVWVSAPFAPLVLKGLVVNPQKPLEFQFIVDTGSSGVIASEVKQSFKEEANRLVKYFLAGITIPEGDLWVNLSPYEKDRITTEFLGQTELGRDLLAQDYVLKQLTASLIYPEKDLGKEFWSRVYKKAQEQFGTTNIPVNTFNKVWILPDQAQVFENAGAAYVTKSTLKVMLDEDYVAFNKNIKSAESRDLADNFSGRGLPAGQAGITTEKTLRKSLAPTAVLRQQDVGARDGFNSPTSTQILRELVIPAIETEVNTGKNFAPLRQIYDAMILAKWYKETIANGLLDAVYTNKKKVAGVNLNDPAVKQQIYERYLQAYKKGVFNYIKEESVIASPKGEAISTPRKYFSGGIPIMAIHLTRNGQQSDVTGDGAMMALTVDLARTFKKSSDMSMIADPRVYDDNFHKEFLDKVQQGNAVFAMIKPDGQKDTEMILKMLQEYFDVTFGPTVNMPADQAARFYETHNGKDFYQTLIDYISKEGPVTPLFLSLKPGISGTAVDLVNTVKRKIRSELVPKEEKTRNKFHSSDTVTSANDESNVIFEFLWWHRDQEILKKAEIEYQKYEGELLKLMRTDDLNILPGRKGKRYDPVTLEPLSFEGISVIHNISPEESKRMKLSVMAEELKQGFKDAGLGHMLAFVDLQSFHATIFDLINVPGAHEKFASSKNTKGYEYDQVRQEIEQKVNEFFASEAGRKYENLKAKVRITGVGMFAPGVVKLNIQIDKQSKDLFEQFRKELHEYLLKEVTAYADLELRKLVPFAEHITIGYVMNKPTSEEQVREFVRILRQINEKFKQGGAYSGIEFELTRGELTGFLDLNHFTPIRLLKKRIHSAIVEIESKLRHSDAIAKADQIIQDMETGKFKLKGEDIDILNGTDENAQVIGTLDRNLAEYYGYIHQTANAVVLTPDRKNIVLTRRAHNITSPLQLSYYGGHLAKGNTHEIGITRELMEELGLKQLDNSPQPIGYSSHDVQGDQNKERRSLFVYVLSQREYEKIRAARQELETRTDKEYREWLENEQKQSKGKGEVWNTYDVPIEILKDPDLIGKGIDLKDSFKGGAVASMASFSRSIKSLVANEDFVKTILNKAGDMAMLNQTPKQSQDAVMLGEGAKEYLKASVSEHSFEKIDAIKWLEESTNSHIDNISLLNAKTILQEIERRQKDLNTKVEIKQEEEGDIEGNEFAKLFSQPISRVYIGRNFIIWEKEPKDKDDNAKPQLFLYKIKRDSKGILVKLKKVRTLYIPHVVERESYPYEIGGKYIPYLESGSSERVTINNIKINKEGTSLEITAMHIIKIFKYLDHANPDKETEYLSGHGDEYVRTSIHTIPLNDEAMLNQTPKQSQDAAMFRDKNSNYIIREADYEDRRMFEEADISTKGNESLMQYLHGDADDSDFDKGVQVYVFHNKKENRVEGMVKLVYKNGPYGDEIYVDWMENALWNSKHIDGKERLKGVAAEIMRFVLEEHVAIYSAHQGGSPFVKWSVADGSILRLFPSQAIAFLKQQIELTRQGKALIGTSAKTDEAINKYVELNKKLKVKYPDVFKDGSILDSQAPSEQINNDVEDGDILGDEMLHSTARIEDYWRKLRPGLQGVDGKTHIIGIVGGIGSGKSTARKLLERYPDVGSIDFDFIRHSVFTIDQVKNKLAETLGKDILKDEEINRTVYKKMRLANDNNRQKLWDILIPYIYSEIYKRILDLKKNPKIKLIVIEGVTFYGIGMDKIMDEVWLIDASEALRIKRVMQREGQSEQEVIENVRDQRAMLDQIRERTKVIVDNEGDARSLEEQIGREKRRVDSAMKTSRQMGPGGIDLNQINVNRTGKTIKVNFDPAQLNEFLQGGFEGFTPVIINITPIESPLPLLGIGPAKEEEIFAKV